MRAGVFFDSIKTNHDQTGIFQQGFDPGGVPGGDNASIRDEQNSLGCQRASQLAHALDAIQSKNYVGTRLEIECSQT
jgi:hypothetical protein